MKSEKEKPVVRFYFSNSHEPDYHPNHNVPLQDEGYLMPYRHLIPINDNCFRPLKMPIGTGYRKSLQFIYRP
mgnify:CR=1 FL=1